MKILLIVVAVLVLMIGAQSAFAETAYQSGFKHGVIDGKDSCNIQMVFIGTSFNQERDLSFSHMIL